MKPAGLVDLDGSVFALRGVQQFWTIKMADVLLYRFQMILPDRYNKVSVSSDMR